MAKHTLVQLQGKSDCSMFECLSIFTQISPQFEYFL